MKICRIVSAFSPFSFGGADIYAEKISRELVKKNNPTVIISINPSRGDWFNEEENTKIYRFHPLNISTIHHIGGEILIKQGLWTLLDIYSFYSYKKIKDILKKEKPDIVHMHTPLDLTLSAVSAVKSLGLPLVYTLHEYFLLCRRLTLLHGSGEICTERNINPLCKVYRMFARRIVDSGVDMVIAPSQFILDEHRRYGFFKKNKAVVLSHGIDLNTKNEKGAGTAKKPEDKLFNILYTGSLTRHKGVHILINAFKKSKSKNAKLHIFGDGVYSSKLKELAGGDNRIKFYGKLSNQEVQKYYTMADVSVVPSVWYDVRPNVIPESLRAGTPVIGANIGGIPELVQDGYNGYLFEPGNCEDLKEVLERCMKDPEKLRGLRKNTYESIKNLEMSQYIEKLLEIYKDNVEIKKAIKITMGDTKNTK